MHLVNQAEYAAFWREDWATVEELWQIKEWLDDVEAHSRDIHKGKGKNMVGKGKGYGVAYEQSSPARLPTKRARDLSPGAQRVPGRRCCCHQTRCSCQSLLSSDAVDRVVSPACVISRLSHALSVPPRSAVRRVAARLHRQAAVSRCAVRRGASRRASRLDT